AAGPQPTDDALRHIARDRRVADGQRGPHGVEDAAAQRTVVAAGRSARGAAVGDDVAVQRQLQTAIEDVTALVAREACVGGVAVAAGDRQAGDGHRGTFRGDVKDAADAV